MLYTAPDMEAKKTNTCGLTPLISQYIKGLAIIMMVLFHSIGWNPTYFECIFPEAACSLIQKLNNSMQLCVSLFAFLTGWTYCLHQDKSYRYSLGKIVRFLISYWVALLFCSSAAWLWCGYRPSLWQLIQEFWPDKEHPLMCFAWYVPFYVKIMLLLPLVPLIEKIRDSRLKLLAAVLLLGISLIMLRPYFAGASWAPVVLCGYYTARYRLLEKAVKRLVSHKKRKIIVIGPALSALSLFIYILLPTPGVNIGIAAAPIFITGAMLLFIHWQKRAILHPLACLGKNSMNIWFLHCLFFSPITCQAFQPLAFCSNIPILPLIIILGACCMLSIGIGKIQAIVNRILAF